MDKSEYKITLSKDLVEKIREFADKENLSVEEIIQNLVAEKFVVSKPEKPLFPSVALIKEGLNLDKPTNINSNLDLINQNKGIGQTFQIKSAPIKSVNPEINKRRIEIEAEMSELSLLIDTATEDKKNGYAMQYAQLASELNSLL